MYHIAIDGFNGISGNTELNWNLVGTMSLGSAASAGPTLDYKFDPDGEYRLEISGRPMQRYRVDVSCDLANWTPMVVTIADFAGKAYFVDKTLMQMNQQGGVGDPICGPGEITGVAISPQAKRFYRAAAVGSQ
jgi:hypothetical protein